MASEFFQISMPFATPTRILTGKFLKIPKKLNRYMYLYHFKFSSRNLVIVAVHTESKSSQTSTRNSDQNSDQNSGWKVNWLRLGIYLTNYTRKDLSWLAKTRCYSSAFSLFRCCVDQIMECDTSGQIDLQWCWYVENKCQEGFGV